MCSPCSFSHPRTFGPPLTTSSFPHVVFGSIAAGVSHDSTLLRFLSAFGCPAQCPPQGRSTRCGEEPDLQRARYKPTLAIVD